MGKVQHFEVPFDDKERAEKFYKEVFGWGAMDIPEMDYTMVLTGKTDDQGMIQEMGVINGGMYKRAKDEGPVIVLTTESIDDSITKLKEHGGEIVMEKTEVGDMGLYAKFKDSEGNVMGLWESLKK